MKIIVRCILLGFLIVLPMGLIYAEDEEEISDSPEAAVVSEDIYSFSLRLKVPQVLNNTASKGYRKYKRQLIKGNMHIQWKDDGSSAIVFSNLRNQKFKVQGSKVAYTGYEDSDFLSTRYNYIGNNKTGTFATPCLAFFLELEPSYAIGGNNEDNSFYLLLAGYGFSKVNKEEGCRIAYTLSGYAAGTQGCGCSAYTHKSPTREATMCGPSKDKITDVVATWGTWKAKWLRRAACGGISLLR